MSGENTPMLVSTSSSVPSLDVAVAAASWEMFTRASVSSGRTLVIIGEAPGADEEACGVPFVGSAGRQLSEVMESSGLDRREWNILNTFLKRPPNNDLTDESWMLNKTEFRKTYGRLPITEALKKKYLRPEHQWQIEELRTRLRILKPDLILAMGATALWALTGEDAITQWRGTFFTCPYGRAIATLHPASVLYQYANLPLLWADLVKVRLWLDGTLPEPLSRRVWINPTFDEMEAVYTRFEASGEALGVDIETAPSVGQITTVSFATQTEAICIPIWDRHELNVERQNYWSAADEVKAWRWIARFGQLPNVKVMQNGLYDSQYFLDAPVQIRLANWTEDTAVLQHSYQPELQKALGILASLYLNEPSWKQMRSHARDSNKADD